MTADLRTLIPHRPPMLLVDEIVSLTAQAGQSKTHIGADFLFLRADGTVAPEAFCEIIAQSYGVCEGQRRLDAGLSLDGGGYLVSVRDFEVFALARVGDELCTHTQQLDDCFGTRIVQGTVWRGSEKLAQATVYIFMFAGQAPAEVK